jgi:hypothetical protein
MLRKDRSDWFRKLSPIGTPKASTRLGEGLFA